MKTASRFPFRMTGLAAVLSTCLITSVYGSECTGSGCHDPSCVTCQDGRCAHCGELCDPRKMKVCTLLVPSRVVEKRVKVDVVYDQTEREEKYTVFQMVPKTRTFEKEECYLKQEVKTRTITEEKCHIVKTPVEQTFNVKTYHPECREVCDPCGDCPPRMVEVMVESTEPRVNLCEEVQVVVAKTEREISYCVLTPEKRKIPCTEEKYFELVPVTKTRTVPACVPRLVRSEYEVVVCKDIPRQVMCCPKCAKRLSNGR